MPCAPEDLTANDHHLLGATTQLVLDGSGAGTRVLQIHSAGGIHARVLLDRGLDLGATWFAGQPISWTSPAGEHPAAQTTDETWHRRWAGGLLTTCGLTHIGPPGDGVGRHGRYSDTPAEDVTVRRIRRRHQPMLQVRGTVRDTDGLDRGLVLRRTWRWHLGTGTVPLRDEVRNETAQPRRAPLLYHLNLGHPFLAPDSTTLLSGLRPDQGFTPTMGPSRRGPDEVVEHRPDRTSDHAEATVTSPQLGMHLVIRWNLSSLPRAYTWRRREPGCYVHSIEPATAALEPTDTDPWPVLDPGQSRKTGIDVSVRLDPDTRRQGERQ